jgi:N-acyl-D-amino-acid deacylase
MMELLLRGADVLDGTGAPSQRLDVRVSDGHIAEIGNDLDVGTAVVHDLDGLVLAPGFIDLHTHYDAQVLWDPALSPSSWHGVTSVVMGNCGFGIAPTRPEHRDLIVRTLESVEGMSAAALEAGVRWDFETFPEYLDLVESVPKQLNVGAYIGHTPLRLYVMGEDAFDRPAEPGEIARMRDIVRDALRHGALGFATSRAPAHFGAGGRPVPSRLATPDELFGIGEALGDSDAGLFEITPGPGFFIEELGVLSKRTGRSVTWAALITGLDYRSFVGGSMAMNVEGAPENALDMVERTAAADGDVRAQIACRPIVFQFSLRVPYPLGNLPGFKEVLEASRDDRERVYRDRAWRDRVRPQVDALLGGGWRWATACIDETAIHGALRGVPLDRVARERGVDPFDLLCDLALEENLETRFAFVLGNDDEEQIAELLRDPRTILALSDAGAHAEMLCDACFSTHLLGHWVRDKQALDLPTAVWRLTGHIADVLGLATRGYVRRGQHADFVAFDPRTVGAGALERVWDLPAGADRLLAPSVGVEHVWVAGQQVRADGEQLEGVHPGAVIRSATNDG